ncbi:protein of unknown function [Catalinimonas alkaloidigena]|uniref:DUF2779 domain-containing protein n=1 Tax=Catalinimonas alkaloidigena TaxID=1075417 RepID=A0A1G8XW87_9BACT|nr:DUF2779 domain-containing protein [Catalinimonas alkaloidigena]SDJ94444.1 protein of unknown function [Catalinimonas alkaloidigena]
MRGVQCAKSLFLYKNHIQWRDRPTAEQQSRFARGQEVGTLARQLFPGGKDAAALGGRKLARVVEKTRELLAAGESVIYEAAFAHEGVGVQLDILVRRDDKYYAYEVKSSVRVSETYELDASVQYYVITGSGLPLADISIVYLNEAYVREEGPLDLQQLFRQRSVRDVAGFHAPAIRRKIDLLKGVLDRATAPEIDIGPHCHRPYPCDFQGSCWRTVPKHSVFEMADLPVARQFALYRQGMVRMKDVPEAALDRPEQRVQAKAHRTRRPQTDHKALYHFLEPLAYPLYFLHWNAFRTALPGPVGTSPYQLLPFAFGLQYRRSSDEAPRHLEQLAEPEGFPPDDATWRPDPRPFFVKHLLRYTERPGHIVVWEKESLQPLLRDLARVYPAQAEALHERAGRLVSLAEPFRRKWLYKTTMQGKSDWETIRQTMLDDPSRSPFENDWTMEQFYLMWRPGEDLFSREEGQQQFGQHLRDHSEALMRLWEELEQLFRPVLKS